MPSGGHLLCEQVPRQLKTCYAVTLQRAGHETGGARSHGSQLRINA